MNVRIAVFALLACCATAAAESAARISIPDLLRPETGVQAFHQQVDGSRNPNIKFTSRQVRTMNNDTRITIFGTLLGALAGGVACALWALFIWHRSPLPVAMVGALTGGIGGYLRSTIFEAIVYGAVALFVLWGFHRLCEGHAVARVLFSLFAGAVVGKLAGALTTLSGDDYDSNE